MSLNRPHTEEEKSRISQSQLGHSVSTETRARIGRANKLSLSGRNLPEEHRRAISRGLKAAFQQGRISPRTSQTEETRLKISSALRQQYETGTRVTVASDGFRFAQKGRVRPISEKERISAGLKLAYSTGRRSSKRQAPNPEKARIRCALRRARKKGLPATLTTEQWQAILNAYKNRCAYCGGRPKKLQQDHVIPLSKGGGYTSDNIVPACQSCNARKNDRPPPVVPAIRLLL